MEKEILLSVKDLKVSFQTREGEVQAVRGISFDVAKGEALVIVGESGCGKSVTAQTLMRLYPEKFSQIKSGSIELDGIDIVHAEEKTMEKLRGEKIGMIFQDPMTSLNPTMTIGKQISEALRQHKKVNRKEAMKSAVQIIDAVRIPNADKRAKQYQGEFSGGMRQRAMVGLSISCVPQLLIADEPTTALDVTIQAQIVDLLRSIQREENMSIIFITHDLGVAAGIAQKVAVMYAGKIMEQGSAKDIFHNPKHPYTWGLMQSMPKPDQDKNQELFTIDGTPPRLVNPPKGCGFADRCEHCMRICKLEEPPITKLEPGHTCSCWLLDERAKMGGQTVGA